LNGQVTAPVATCNINNNQLANFNAQSSCNGGAAYACADNSPWAVNNTLAYGFAAVNIQGQTETSWCCQCYALTQAFLSILSSFIIDAFSGLLLVLLQERR
jgi:Glycosyl hydrolase family 45